MKLARPVTETRPGTQATPAVRATRAAAPGGPGALTSGCPVCGAHEVARDEVLDAGVLLLAACLRCDHRWTARPLRAVAGPAAGAGTEVAAAA